MDVPFYVLVNFLLPRLVAPLKLCVSLKLLRTFYAEDLVDHKTFLMWLVQQMTTCNLAQAGFLTRLTNEYINDIFSSRALARPLGEACLAKLSEVCSKVHTQRQTVFI
jgi:hypothetical protein